MYGGDRLTATPACYQAGYTLNTNHDIAKDGFYTMI